MRGHRNNIYFNYVYLRERLKLEPKYILSLRNKYFKA